MDDRLRAGKLYRYVTSHPGQLSMVIPLWVGAMSTSLSWEDNGSCTSHASQTTVVYPSTDSTAYKKQSKVRYVDLYSASSRSASNALCKGDKPPTLIRSVALIYIFIMGLTVQSHWNNTTRVSEKCPNKT